ncbi:hypothetical protein BJ138DRAFT_433341 [Hygrophoropsis aurantiaca]|uniref:Uncharacterized protein n=1 Tax=Hygrophoropsis aurantiaca TaxID=72124 RepID=A0ACB8A3A2_9AGAM|nr:hypothetical protein BJ138DRAFT_433341 [Hygrophoropsis aurantiaca]
MRSRSSSIRISRLPSFTSTLSSDQSSTQDIFSPPVSVIVHGDTQHELHAAYELLAPKRDSCVLGSSPLPSPTMSTFSSSWNPGTELETEATTPYASFPASPASASFAASICLPASPESDKLVFPDAPAIETGNTNSRWSLATTASLAPSTAEPKTGYFTRPKTPSKNKAPKSPTTETAPSLLKTPTRKRTRFISLISRLSPRSENPPPAAQSPDDDNDSVDELDDDAEDIPKPVRGPSKKSSLASLRASFSLSRASFASHRPLDEEVPPLPTPTSASWPMPASPPRNSFSASRVSLAGGTPETEVIPPVPSRRPSGLSLRAEPSWSSLRGDAEPTSPTEEIPPMPTSASTVTSFSQIPPPPHSSRVSLAHSMSRASLVSRVSLAPSISQVSLSEFPAPPSTPGRARSLFGRPKTPSSANGKTPNTKIPSSKKSTSIKIKPRLSKLPMPASTDKLPFPASTAGVPPVPRSFVPPTKLRQPMPSLPPSPTSKLPPPPYIADVVPPTPSKDASMVSGTTTRLPVPSAQTPASPSQSKMATVRGFWRRGTLQV